MLASCILRFTLTVVGSMLYSAPSAWVNNDSVTICESLTIAIHSQREHLLLCAFTPEGVSHTYLSVLLIPVICLSSSLELQSDLVPAHEFAHFPVLNITSLFPQVLTIILYSWLRKCDMNTCSHLQPHTNKLNIHDWIMYMYSTIQCTTIIWSHVLCHYSHKP